MAMLIALLNKIERSRWPHLVGISLLVALFVAIMFAEAQWQRPLGILAFLSSMYVGLFLGTFVGHLVARPVFETFP